MRNVLWVLAAVGLGSGVAWSARPTGPPADADRLTVVRTDWRFPEHQAGRPLTITVEVRNPSAVPGEVVGLGLGCGLNCCFHTDHPLRFPVPPYSTAAVPVEVGVPRSGPFDHALTVFVRDRGRLWAIPVRVSGQAAP